jgi:hypothetical protein
MIKAICIYVFITILFATQSLIAQGDFSSYAECEQSIYFLKNNCFVCSKENKNPKCKVEEFKYLGEVDNHFYYSSITLEYDSASGMDLNKEYNTRDVTIFEGSDKENVKPVYFTGGSFGVFEHVFTELISTDVENFIHIDVSDGNGHWDSGEYFIFKKDSWYKLEVPEAADSLISIIPKTYKFCKGSRVDLKNMTADISVYTPNDACCCPTGGTARAYLRLTDDNRIIITKTKYFPNIN